MDWYQSEPVMPLPEILKELTPAQQQELSGAVLAVLGNLTWSDAADLISKVKFTDWLKDLVKTAIIKYFIDVVKAEIQNAT